MKRKHISDALEHLDPAYIDEATGFVSRIRLYKRPYFRLIAIAACLIVCFSVLLVTNIVDRQTPPIDTPPTTTVTTTVGSAEESTTSTEAVTTEMSTTTAATTTQIVTVPDATTTSTAKATTTSRKIYKSTAKKTTTTSSMITIGIPKATTVKDGVVMPTSETTAASEITTTTTTKIYKSTAKESTTTSETTTATSTAVNMGDPVIQTTVTGGITTTTKVKRTVNHTTTTRYGDPSTTVRDPNVPTTTTASKRPPTRPNGAFGELEFRTDLRLQIDKQEYQEGDVITVTIENTTEETLEIDPWSIFMASQTADGEWNRGWTSLTAYWTSHRLAPGEIATTRVALAPSSWKWKAEEKWAIVCCVGEDWVRSETFSVYPSSETTSASLKPTMSK